MNNGYVYDRLNGYLVNGTIRSIHDGENYEAPTHGVATTTYASSENPTTINWDYGSRPLFHIDYDEIGIQQERLRQILRQVSWVGCVDYETRVEFDEEDMCGDSEQLDSFLRSFKVSKGGGVI